MIIISFSCNKTQKTKTSAPQNIPGYYEQWLYIKTNGTNILPSINPFKEVFNNKRANSNALLSMNEYGPSNIGGRTRAMIIDWSNPNRIILGGVSGGIFISNDKGTTWNPINDHQLTPAVTYLNQDFFNPKVMYYCTGEGSGNSADIAGNGVYKSTDGGLTFNQLSATNNNNFRQSWSLKCSPKDSNTLYVATLSNGLWRSKDAGTTFSRVYSTPSQISDLELFPNGVVMFTIKGNGVYRSTTGDLNTFTKINSIISTSSARGELAFCKNFPNVVYAAISGPDNGYDGFLKAFYKSSDGGLTFVEKTNPTGIIDFGFTWYTLTMEVKNNDSNAIFLGSVFSGYSKNGGNSWTAAQEQHADHHIAISTNNELFVGSDGGLCVYNWSNLRSFTSLNNRLNITQLYAGDVSPHRIAVLGGCQDNGTIQGINKNQAFSAFSGGDGGYCYYHANDENTVYVSTQNGNVYAGFNKISDNIPTDDTKWFIHPFVVSQTDGDQLIYPSNQNLYFSSDQGNSFSLVKKIGGGRLFSGAFSDGQNPSVYSAGSSVLLAIDSIMNSNPKIVELRSIGLPVAIRASFFSSVKVVNGFRDKIYVSLGNISDSGRVYLVSNIFGTPVFKNISGNLPKGLPVNYIECDPLNPENVLFAGTDFGLYISENGGQTWIKDTRVPSTVVSAIKIHKNKKDIYVFTHGRGIFSGQINNAGFSDISDSKIENEVLLYPNPAKNNLNIDAASFVGAQYKIFNAQGQEFLKGNIAETVQNINIENLSAGIYFIELKKGNQKLFQRIVISR